MCLFVRSLQFRVCRAHGQSHPWVCKILAQEHMLTLGSPYTIKVIVSGASREAMICHSVLSVTRCLQRKNKHANDLCHPSFTFPYRHLWDV